MKTDNTQKQQTEQADAAIAEATKVAESLATATGAQRIVLFGSRARRTATADSDMDLLIIVDNSADATGAGHAGYRALGLHSTPIDLLVMRAVDYAESLQVPGTVAFDVARDGLVVYDRAA